MGVGWLFEHLRGIDCFDVEVYVIAEGSVIFRKVHLMRIEGLYMVVIFIF